MFSRIRHVSLVTFLIMLNLLLGNLLVGAVTPTTL